MTNELTPPDENHHSSTTEPNPSGDDPSAAAGQSGPDATGTPAAQESGQPAGSLSEDAVREQLKQVIDPELFVNIVDLGLIYVVDLKPSEQAGQTDVHVEMTMTSPMCPAGPQLVANSRQVIEAMPGVGTVEIKVVMDPPWTQDRMSEDARDQLGIF